MGANLAECFIWLCSFPSPFLYSSLANPSLSSFTEPRLVAIAAVFALAGQVSYVHSLDSIEICNVSDNWWNRPVGTAGL